MKVSRLPDTEGRRLDRVIETSNTVWVGAWSVAALALVLGAVSIAIALGAGSRPELSLMAWVMTSPVLGLLLVVRGGAVRMGGLLLAIGFAGAIAALSASIPHDPAFVSWLWLISLGTPSFFIFLTLTYVGLPLLFPTGNPPSSRWQPVLWLLIGVLTAVTVMGTFGPEVETLCSDSSPTAADCATWETLAVVLRIERCEEAEPDSDVVEVEQGPEVVECRVILQNPMSIAGIPMLEKSLPGDLAFVGLIVAAVLALASMGVRVRKAASRERQQIKFLFTALGLLILWTLAEILWVDVLGRHVPLHVESTMEFIAWMAIPVSIYLAVLRYRLYEIDRIISRTVSYAIVVGLLVGGVVSVSTLVSTRFDSPLVVAATTLGVAAVFNPLRRRVQRVIDRRFNRSRYDLEQVMSSFSETLRERVDADRLMDGWVDVVSETMQPSQVGYWVRNSQGNG